MTRTPLAQKPGGARHRKLAIVVSALCLTVAAGCCLQPTAPTATTPAAVAPVVAAWLDLGLSCGEPVVGMPENAPQWSCQGQLHGAHVNAEFLGDNAGLMDMTLEIASSTPRETATAIFADAVTATPAFAARHAAIVSWLDAWEGVPGTVTADFTDAHASVMRDALWVDFSVTRIPYFSSPDPSSS